MEQYLEIGRIINKRGIKGEIKVEPYSNSEEDFFDYKKVYLSKDGTIEKKIESCKTYKGFVYLKLSGTDTPEAADKLRGKYLYVDRTDILLDKNEIFFADIIGLNVIDLKSGRIYGKVTEIVNYGKYDTYIVSSNKKEYMLPAVAEFINRIDIEKGIFITPIPGLFDDEVENVKK